MRTEIKGKTVVVTGGAGFIGSHLVDKLVEDGAKKVIAIDNMFLGQEENLSDALKHQNVVLYRDDIEFRGILDHVFDAYDVDVVFNCATKALNYSFVNPENAFSTNVTGTLNLLELLRLGKYKTLCHFSTSEVYGTAVYEPMDEKHPRIPTTTYAAGKAAADLAVESYVRMFGLDAFIVRPFNNYGPRQNFKGPLAGVIPITAYKIINGISPEIHGTGEQSRDFIHVKDTVDAVVALYKVVLAGESVNVCADNQVSINTLIPKICDLMGYKGSINRHPSRHSDVEAHKGDNAKVKSLIDFKTVVFDDGLKSTIDWYSATIRKA